MEKENFVENVKFLCSTAGTKPTVACRESGVGTSFLSDVNRGQTPSVAKVQLLAAYLGVTTSELLGEVPIGTPPGDILTPEARQVAKAYERATEKDQAVVRTILEVKP